MKDDKLKVLEIFVSVITMVAAVCIGLTQNSINRSQKDLDYFPSLETSIVNYKIDCDLDEKSEKECRLFEFSIKNLGKSAFKYKSANMFNTPIVLLSDILVPFNGTSSTVKFNKPLNLRIAKFLLESASSTDSIPFEFSIIIPADSSEYTVKQTLVVDKRMLSYSGSHLSGELGARVDLNDIIKIKE